MRRDSEKITNRSGGSGGGVPGTDSVEGEVDVRFIHGGGDVGGEYEVGGLFWDVNADLRRGVAGDERAR